MSKRFGFMDFRYPAWKRETQEEMRAREFGIPVRAKRTFGNRPTCWWDIARERQRSWKAYRQTQFKSI